MLVTIKTKLFSETAIAKNVLVSLIVPDILPIVALMCIIPQGIGRTLMYTGFLTCTNKSKMMLFGPWASIYHPPWPAREYN